jgi:hypothetical protein
MRKRFLPTLLLHIIIFILVMNVILILHSRSIPWVLWTRVSLTADRSASFLGGFFIPQVLRVDNLSVAGFWFPGGPRPYFSSHPLASRTH